MSTATLSREYVYQRHLMDITSISQPKSPFQCGTEGLQPATLIPIILKQNSPTSRLLKDPQGSYPFSETIFQDFSRTSRGLG